MRVIHPTVLFNLRLPEDIHSKLKASAGPRGMNRLIVSLIHSYLEAPTINDMANEALNKFILSTTGPDLYVAQTNSVQDEPKQ